MEYRDAEQRLREFFGSAESIAGLRSTHGALTASQNGGRSATAPDAHWTDARVARVASNRETAATLRAMMLTSGGRAHVGVLWAYYGQPGWPGPAPDWRVKQVWRRTRPPPDVRLALGDDLGRVALLTAALTAAVAKWATPQSHATVLAALCRAGGDVLAPVETEASAAHKAALAAFGDVGRGDSRPEEQNASTVAKRASNWGHAGTAAKSYAVLA